MSRNHHGRPRIVWFPEMVAELVALRTRQPRPASIPVCAKRIGVSSSVVRAKARELGLNHPTYPGPRPGSQADRPRDALGQWKPAEPRQPREAAGHTKTVRPIGVRVRPQAAVAPPEGWETGGASDGDPGGAPGGVPDGAP